ncbi:MAG TPA: PA14 domain-containing protein [Bryobacteraceae bacterium]|nr:PA14 domain-containing protein [Bryobacteraceae bacterium]
MKSNFRSVLVCSTLFLPAFWLGGAARPAAAQSLDSEESAFLTLINNFRAQNGAGPLQVSAALENSSTWMSNDMATKNYFSHTDSLGRDPGTRMAAFGYPYYPWGENIAAGNSDAQSTFNQLATACDPDASGNCTYAHRQNMLNASFVVIGIGRAYSGTSTYGWYWTTDFGGVVDQTITTAPSPTPAPAITSFTATPSAITAGQPATLSWKVSGASSLSINNGIGGVSTVSSISVSPSVTTTYTLTATNSAGSTAAHVTVTVAAPADTQAPTAPALASASAKSPTEVDLAWNASTDNVAVAGYQILRNGSVLTSVPGTSLGYADTTVAPNSTYTYSLKAFDAAGNYSAAGNLLQVTTPSAPVSGVCPAPASGAFTGCYYNNLTLSGAPAFVRTDSAINFDWFYAPPDKSLTPQNFSVAWQGSFNFSGGTYTFTLTTSDGMRLYIDGVPIFDRWIDQPTTMYRVQFTLTQGTHLVTVQYYEHTGNAFASVAWQANTAPTQGPVVSSFAATPSIVTAGQRAVLSWNVSGAASVSIDQGVGNVSNSTSVSVSPSVTTTYTLTATNSSGSTTARATVTVNSALDTQPPTAPVLVSAAARTPSEVDLAWNASADNIGVAGYQIFRNGTALASVSGTSLSYADTGAAANTTYTYSLKAFDAAGNYSPASNTAQVTTPAAPVSGVCPAPASGAFTGCYYSNATLSGAPAFVRTDNKIQFDWLYGPPDKSLGSGPYSVRWQGNFTFAAGTYTFTMTASDGMRVYIDSIPVFDHWLDQAPTMYRIQFTPTPGTHLVTVEYYEETGNATASVSWQMN